MFNKQEITKIPDKCYKNFPYEFIYYMVDHSYDDRFNFKNFFCKFRTWLTSIGGTKNDYRSKLNINERELAWFWSLYELNCIVRNLNPETVFEKKTNEKNSHTEEDLYKFEKNCEKTDFLKK